MEENAVHPLKRIAAAIKNPGLALDYGRYHLVSDVAHTAFGGRLRVSTYSEFRAVRNLALSPPELRLIDMIPANGHIVDVGAHVGVWSVPLALARPKATVHSFEASPPTFDQLRKNVAANRLTNIRLNQTAVFDHDGTLTFQMPENASAFGRVASTMDAEGRYKTVTEVTTPCISLESYCRQEASIALSL